MSRSNGAEPSKADSLRAKYASHLRTIQRSIDRELPAYRDYQDSGEITANTSGLHAKGIPREAWRWIGIGIGVFIVCLGVAVVVALL